VNEASKKGAPGITRNGYFGCTCYHALFVFNQQGDLELQAADSFIVAAPPTRDTLDDRGKDVARATSDRRPTGRRLWRRTMEMKCPRCHTPNREIARFCARCGLSLKIGVNATRRAGRIRHPQPAAAPDGYTPCREAADLYYRTESSLGGETLIGTEGVNVVVFNAGYPLREVVLEVRGEGKDGQELFKVERGPEDLPHAKEVSLEIPSYELPAPLGALRVSLMSAEFGPEE